MTSSHYLANQSQRHAREKEAIKLQFNALPYTIRTRAMKRECMIRIRYENIFNVLLAFFLR